MELLITQESAVTRISADLSKLLEAGKITTTEQAESMEIVIKTAKRIEKQISTAATTLNKPYQAKVKEVGKKKKEILGDLPAKIETATGYINLWLDAEIKVYNKQVQAAEERYSESFINALHLGADIGGDELLELEQKKEVEIATLPKPTGIRNVREIRVTNIKVVPREYLTLDIEKVRIAIEDGITIPGVSVIQVAKRSGR